MKKLLTALLAVVLTLTLAVPAFAAELTALNGTDSHPVNGTYDAATGVYLTVYSVDIAWGDMAFTYDGGDWNAATHSYDGTGWNYETNHNRITVSNNSNTGITASLAYASAAAYDEITGLFYASDATDPANLPITAVTLAAPATVLAGAAVSATPSGSAYLKLSGELLSDTLVTASVQVGTITVTLNAAP